MSTAIELLHGSSIFCKLDLRNDYHLVRIREGDEWKIKFTTPTGHYKYLVMPFSLTNAHAVFQALVNDVMRDMINKLVFIYLDDILIFFSFPVWLYSSCTPGPPIPPGESALHQSREIVAPLTALTSTLVEFICSHRLRRPSKNSRGGSPLLRL